MEVFTKRRVVAASLLFALVSAAPAQAQVEAGVLTCRGTGGHSYIVGSFRQLACVFHPSRGGPIFRYQATIQRAGVDLGFTNAERLGWAVFAPTRQIRPNDLEGHYGGVSAGASFVVGGTANALTGGVNHAFALQPLSLQAQRGLNVSAGIADMDLHFIRR